ncbi:MAG: preprotein translocase subunit SecA [Candidatus Coatesbacteria bacterium]|nr:preprotein translocase subunit SecA [Candidatus Coatesbacteria bacterium]
MQRIKEWLGKIFPNRNEREITKLKPFVQEINRLYEDFKDLPPEQLKAKTEEFRDRLKQGETLDDILEEAFATVKAACFQMYGTEIEVTGQTVVWDMIPFDVQLIGGIVLHQGKIAEMKTGEGKTLVATLPTYLNALPEERHVHIITVNDYLARRDAAWVGSVLKYLGLTVGCIQGEMRSNERQYQYACDVVYGTNSEFGFDYLRDNMAFAPEDVVQTSHDFAIIDEVDSILIDEARTPLIISGEVEQNAPEDQYNKIKPIISRLYKEQNEKVTIFLDRVDKLLSLASIAPVDEEEGEVVPDWEGFDRLDIKAELLLKLFKGDEFTVNYFKSKDILDISPEKSRENLERVKHELDNWLKAWKTDDDNPDFKNDRIINADISDLLYTAFDDEIVNKSERAFNNWLTEVWERLVAANLLKAVKGAPKSKRLQKLLKSDEKTFKRVEDYESSLMRDKLLYKFLAKDLLYIVEERHNSVEITEKGHEFVESFAGNILVLPDHDVESRKIMENTDIPDKEKAIQLDTFQKSYMSQTEKLHNVNQLLKAYTLFEKDVSYVVQNNQVVIVDEFTGRLQPSRRYSDGLHQALQAKENVVIEKETQTLATITIQNYFRMYDKLAGMTGTAETEALEFNEIYKLDVIVIPTNEPVRRIDYDDQIYRTKAEKYKYIIDEVIRCNEIGQPVLVGTVSVAVSEKLSRMLKIRGVQHEVLNARYHQREAEIVAKAGQKGAVTIATNMAGRGTDIRLGKDVVRCISDKGEVKCCIICRSRDEFGNKACQECFHENSLKACSEDIPCGLHIIGTERHEARRIDRQLRGRSGRQGDPGSSRFFLSLEDDLMRIFGSSKMATIMDRIGTDEDGPMMHPWLTKAIDNSQKRVEAHHFEIRKHLLEYDDVMNKQREVIYAIRRKAVFRENLQSEIDNFRKTAVESVVSSILMGEKLATEKDYQKLSGELARFFGIYLSIDINDSSTASYDAVLENTLEAINLAYGRKLENAPDNLRRLMESHIILMVIDEHWRQHLYTLDDLREGINLRAYGQSDPLQEYKKEAFELFQNLEIEIAKEVTTHLQRFEFKEEIPEETPKVSHIQAFHPDASASLPVPEEESEEGYESRREEEVQKEKPKGITYKRTQPKIKPNDPCPCGSGKKYKKCCGKK